MKRKKKGFTITIELHPLRAVEKVNMDKMTRPKRFKSGKDYSRKSKHKQNFEEM